MQKPAGEPMDDYEAADRALADTIFSKKQSCTAAQGHLRAGRAIYYREDDTPSGMIIKEMPDGGRFLVLHEDGHDTILKTLDPV